MEYSWGSSSRFSIVGFTKVKACKSYLFTEGFLKVENNEDGWIISKIVGISEDCDQNGARYLRTW